MRRVARWNQGSACSKTPRAKIARDRHSTRPTSPAARSSSRGPSASGIDTPTMKRKNGKIMSVGVNPLHSACRRGQ